jgi:E3 ubiquitin-protein ligase HUWE1
VLVHQLFHVWLRTEPFFPERTSQNTLHTLLLVKLTSNGGLDLIVKTCKAFAETVESTKPDLATRSAEETDEFNVATAGLGVALHLLHPLSSSKPLLESGQTSALATRDKPKTDPSYFEPHEFLVKLRATVFPMLRSFWDALWLAKAPQDIAKLVVQGFLEIMAAEGEEASPGSNNLVDLFGAGSLFPSGSRRAPPAGPDENRIQQLCDMGFPRASAELALTRTHNNLSAATEYLLLHPFPLVAPGAGNAPQLTTSNEANRSAETEGNAEDPHTTADETAEATAGEGTRDVEMEEASATPADESPDNVEPSVSEPLVVDERDWVSELKHAREAAVPDIASRALWILGKFPELVFDIKKAFTGDKYQAQAVRTLISDAKSFTNPADISDDAALASRLRLLALVLSELSPSSSLALEDASPFAMSFAEKLRGLPSSGSTDGQPVATWLAPLLLSLEALLVLGEEFEPVVIPKADEPIVPIAPKPRNPHDAVRPIIFDFCYNFLSRSMPDRNELIACLRLLVLLTKSHRMATEFVSRGGLPLLLDRFKGTGNNARGCQVHIILILRHIIEDRSVLESLVKRDLILCFSQSRPRATDVGTFLRHNSHVALRDSAVFIDSCKAVCMLSSSSPSGSNFSITLKSDISTSPHHSDAVFDMPVVPLNHSNTVEADAAHEDILQTSQTVESLDILLRYLLSEVTRVGKTVMQASWSAGSPENVPSNRPALDSTAAATSATSPTGTNPTTDHSVVDYVYTCFLLQCLTELLSAYNSCKLAFTNYSRKRVGTPSKDSSSKPRAAALQFILSEMVSIGDMNATATTATPTIMKKRMTLSLWAMSVVVALCLDPSVASNIKDIPTEVIAARKLVLEFIAKSIREALPGESLESRYSRLSALAELTFRLLSRTSAAPGGPKPTGDAHLHIPKVMLEKNFVALLTSTLGEIDLNFPNVRSLVTTLLRPLELLCVVEY